MGGAFTDPVFRKPLEKNIFNVKSVSDCATIDERTARPRGVYPNELQSVIDAASTGDYLLGSARNACFIWQAIKSKNPAICTFDGGFRASDCLNYYTAVYPETSCQNLKNYLEKNPNQFYGKKESYNRSIDSIYNECEDNKIISRNAKNFYGGDETSGVLGVNSPKECNVLSVNMQFTLEKRPAEFKKVDEMIKNQNSYDSTIYSERWVCYAWQAYKNSNPSICLDGKGNYYNSNFFKSCVFFYNKLRSEDNLCQIHAQEFKDAIATMSPRHPDQKIIRQETIVEICNDAIK